MKRPPGREPELGCCICLEDGFLDAVNIGTCGHTFCEGCIVNSLGTAATPACPCCRAPITANEMVPNYHAPKRARVLSMPTEHVI